MPDEFDKSQEPWWKHMDETGFDAKWQRRQAKWQYRQAMREYKNWRRQQRKPCGSLSAVPGIGVGIFLIGFGVLLFLDNIGILRIRDIWQFWPLFISMIGMQHLSKANTMGGRLWGVLGVAGGVVLVLNNLHLFHLTMGAFWALALIGFGFVMLVQALEKHTAPPDSPDSPLPGTGPQAKPAPGQNPADPSAQSFYGDPSEDYSYRPKNPDWNTAQGGYNPGSAYTGSGGTGAGAAGAAGFTGTPGASGAQSATRAESSNVHPSMDTFIKEAVVFWGAERRIDSQDFRGGELVAIFGGISLDLRRAGISPTVKEVVIDAVAVFGGIEIEVPDNWEVSVRGVGVFGGYENKTIPPRRDAGAFIPRLVITGSAVFGGISIQ